MGAGPVAHHEQVVNLRRRLPVDESRRPPALVGGSVDVSLGVHGVLSFLEPAATPGRMGAKKTPPASAPEG
jgi:hypothetical protein